MVNWAKMALVGLTVTALTEFGSARVQRDPGAGASESPILLELFTSEGCSSCPPADALLRKLNGTSAASGQLLIGLSEHVTYWNRLGWADPFSSDKFTDRQSAYSERFHLDSVYTPQLVVNGNAQVVGSNTDEVERAIEAQRRLPAPLMVHILSSKPTGGQLNLTFSVPSTLPQGGADLYAVIADDLDRSNVLRGENGGRTLSHAAVARNFVHLGRIQKSTAREEVAIPLPPQSSSGAKQHIVLFAQAPSFGPVLGVDSQPIEKN